MTDDPALRRKKPAHVSSNETVASFADFATTSETRCVHPPPEIPEFDDPPAGALDAAD